MDLCGWSSNVVLNRFNDALTNKTDKLGRPGQSQQYISLVGGVRCWGHGALLEEVRGFTVAVEVP